MSQTANGQNTAEKTPGTDEKGPRRAANYRPGQRQQERMQRLARRQKRRRIFLAVLAAIAVIAASITGTVLFQNYSAQQALLASQRAATATAHANATATVYANATATVVTKNCFITPGAPAIPEVYSSSTAPTSGPTTAPALSGTPVSLKGGLKYIDIKTGTGAVAQTGKSVTVNYTGWLASTCQKFDSSYDSHATQTGQSVPAQPATLTLAQGQVISGWVEGVTGMKVGGIRRLYIPAALGYGAQSQGPIPANSDLIFDVQMVAVK